MENTKLENKKNVSTQMQEILQKELDKYIQDPASFSSYLETMGKIDHWLEKGEEK
ncbi:MAG: hypothetical protein PHX13_02935 [Thiovulaceae bacterium]|nr:hypothetical protein [Sulfurimonadaceae bacterium]